MSGKRRFGLGALISLLIRGLWRLSDFPQRGKWMKAMASSKRLPHDVMKMIDGVLGVSDLRARDIMLSRAQMVMIDDHMPLEMIEQIVIESGHSRFPVRSDHRDKIEGILLAKDLLKFYDKKTRESFDIKQILRPAFYVPEGKRLNELLQEFRRQHTHLAVVMDEYGGVAGLVTIEDILEQIVGEIEDEYDDECEEWIKPAGKRKWVINGLTAISAFNEFFETDLPDDKLDTLGGWVTHRLGHVAKKRDKVSEAGFEFTVLHTDAKRIKLLRVRKLDAKR